MFCKKCGTKLNDDALFCAKCGERMGAAQAGDSSQRFESAVSAVASSKEPGNAKAAKQSSRSSIIAFLGGGIGSCGHNIGFNIYPTYPSQ